MKARKLMETKKKPLDLKLKTKQVVLDPSAKPRSPKRKEVMVRDLYDDAKAEPSLMERVKEVQANLDVNFPTFVKFMIQSNVNVGFLLNFPRSFSVMHMPAHDATVVLVDTSQKEYRTKYLVGKNRLSAGWRSFSVAHKLIVGDVLVFQLIEHCKFKVYIVRTSELDEVDGANALLHLKADTRRCNSGKYHAASDTGSNQKEKESHLEHLPPANVPKNEQSNCHEILEANHVTDRSANVKDVGLLLEEITNEATSIANAAKASNLLLSHHDGFASLKENSKGLKEACVIIGSLHARLDCLDSLALEAKQAVESQKDRRTMSGRVQTEEEKKNLAVKLLKLVEAKIRLGAEMETLKANTKRLELKCQQQA